MDTLCVLAHFDAPGSEAIRQVKAVLCRHGVACDALPPHITLGIYEGLAPEALLAWCEAFAAAHPPLSVGMSHIGLFGAGTCFAAPRVDEGLLALHRAFHARFDDHCTGAGATTSLAGGLWVPHCTLFQGSIDEVCRVLPVAAATFSPFQGHLAGLTMGRFVASATAFVPGDELAMLPFSGSTDKI